MITGVHTLLYSGDPDATRAFLRDVLQLPFTETSPGWLIFDTGPSESGAHPRTWPGRDEPYGQRHEVMLMCDDLDATIAELGDRGARFVGDVWRQDFGRGTSLAVPGMDPIVLVEPAYAPAWESRVES